MRLRDLIHRAGLGGDPAAFPDAVVTAVTQDAAQVTPGAIFVARQGARFDGHAFVPDAVAAGATLVVGERHDPPRRALAGVPYLRVEDARGAVARLAATLHGHPSRRTRVVGVTGTDGKTTTSALTWWLLQGPAGDAPPVGDAALLSTALVRLGRDAPGPPGGFTTPEANEVQAFLAAAVDAGAGHVVLESSSHGLALRRLDAVAYALAIWTNLTPEHLDFHGSFEAYRDAKGVLIERAAHAILCRDDATYDVYAALPTPSTSYGADPRADWRLLAADPTPGGQTVRLAAPDGHAYAGTLPLPGRHNALNALAAVAAAAHEGVPADVAVARLASFPGIPGRMQVVASDPFALVVDFAHTPPALAAALDTVRPMAGPGGRVRVVIGAAGERDPGKRAPLGEVAARHADVAYFTEEDARGEDVHAILAALADGARAAGGEAGRTYHLHPDRRDAIRAAVADAAPGDVVLLAGKGPEATLERADGAHAWDEVAEARAAWAALARPPS